MADIATPEELADLGIYPETAPESDPVEPVALTPGRALQRRSRSTGVRPRKLSNERMVRVCRAMAEMPVGSDACMRAGISFSTLQYWLTKSLEGSEGDGFDVTFPGDDPDEAEEPVRFHIAWEDAVQVGLGRVEKTAFDRALGYQEVGTFQGRVVYKIDPDAIALGLEGPDAFLKDANGAPVPETWTKQDPDMIQMILKARKSDVYGNKQQVDVNVRGGVLVVQQVATSSASLIEDNEGFKQEAIDVEFEEVEEDDPTS